VLGGLALGLSVSAKLLPGMLLVPLLIGRPWRASAATGVTVVGLHLPFALWDARGLWMNLVAFNLERPTDSTALSHFLPPSLRPLLLGAFALFALLGALRGVRRRWPLEDALGYAVSVLLVLFMTAKVFHNNYTLWLLPFLGVWMAEWLRGAQPPAGGQRDAASARAPPAPVFPLLRGRLQRAPRHQAGQVPGGGDARGVCLAQLHPEPVLQANGEGDQLHGVEVEIPHQRLAGLHRRHHGQLLHQETPDRLQRLPPELIFGWRRVRG